MDSTVTKIDSMESARKASPNPDERTVLSPSQPPPPEPSQYPRRTESRMRNKHPSTTAERPLADVISERFPAFDADASVVRPFADDAARDAKFEEELGTMLLDVMLKTHAWAASRPKHEAAVAGRSLETQIAQVMQTEAEQGTSSPPASVLSEAATVSSFHTRVVEQTRQRLAEFVHRMKNALAALMGTL